jgi:NitT/TauT family transport system permease protein
MVTPIVADELSTGLSNPDCPLEEMSDLFGFSPWRRFLTWKLPSALPYFFGAITTSVGFAWKAGIAAEILAATFRSVGREIYQAKLYLEIDKLWAYTLTVVVFSVILEFSVKKTLHYIERRTAWVR